jgi:hypothetical protein
MLLADELVERPWPHPHGERLGPTTILSFLGGKERHGGQNLP